MKKLLKFSAVLIILALLAMIGLAVFVNTYFTDERLRAILVPPMEELLGREVEIGHIEVSLFTGINVYDVAVKEENGVDNFFSSNRFILSYDLVPLLQKQVVINEVRLVAPQVIISRNKEGLFNFATLALLAQQDKPQKSAPANPAANLPVSITVDKLVIDKGRLKVQDASGVIPATTVEADMSVALGLQQGLADLSFQGEANFTIDTNYHGLKPLCAGNLNFSRSRIAYTIDLALGEDLLNLSGNFENYLTGLPPIVLNINSRRLDIQRLQKAMATLPKNNDSAQSSQTAQPSALDNLEVQGLLYVAALTYGQLEIKDLSLDYVLSKGTLSCKDLSGDSMGGEIRGELRTELGKEQAYKGRIGIHGIKLDELQRTFSRQELGGAKGQLSSAFEFAGAGLGLERVRSNLTANGEVEVVDGRLASSALSQGVASLLNLPELKEINFKDLTGQFLVRSGRVELNSSMASGHLSGRSTGSIGLDGSLEMPLTLTLSPELSQRLEQRLEVAKYLEKRGGQTIVRLDVQGSLADPAVRLNEKYIKRQATGTLVDQVLGDNPSANEQAAGQAVKGVLDSLFGK